MNAIRPPALRAGDVVAVLAPSSSVQEQERLEDGVEVLRSWGFEVQEGRHLRGVHGHLAGTDAARLEDLQRALVDPAVRAVFVGRGGYGVQRIVDQLDWPAVRSSPTLLVGFSDLTALLHAAWRRAGLVTVHGPSVSRLGSIASRSAARLEAMITGHEVAPISFESHQVAVGGVASGRLLGGNLALICAGIGTPDELQIDGDLLLLEDVNEAPYAIDRMLTQLRRAGLLDRAAGVVVARWVGCDPPSGRPSSSAAEVTVERLGDLGIPLVVDLPLGHAPQQLPVAHGASATLDTSEGSLQTGSPVT
ncbi:MAG: LD-carboxypeptidase [Nitriliruptorales bacterium]|nr:LD-carboxypeptidase [Nitriliruptorales bacterium]